MKLLVLFILLLLLLFNIIIIINYFIIMAVQSVTKRLEAPTYFIWPKSFLRHCVIHAALAH